jgi:hypothetical protein
MTEALGLASTGAEAKWRTQRADGRRTGLQLHKQNKLELVGIASMDGSEENDESTR